jgi:hypothetical protein
MASRTAEMLKAKAAGRHRTQVRVVFDRRLVGILGDEHYPDAEYLFHELATNAYDADATEVRFTYRSSEDADQLGGYKLVVEDNGNGMSLPELEGYFTLGGSRKIGEKRSPRLKRPLIGRFGLGKVSALKAAQRWFLETEQGGRRYFVDVDFEKWMADENVPGFTVEPRKPTGKNGTRIELVGVRVRGFRGDRIVRAIRKLPLGPKFRVYLNKDLVPPRVWDGFESHEVEIEVPIPWPDGKRRESVKGTIWISENPMSLDEGTAMRENPTLEEVYEKGLDVLAGVEIKVHGATITREFFGRQQHGHGVNYLWGFVNADWLPVVANRTDYVRDSDEGQAFFKAMEIRFTEIWLEWRRNEEKRRQLRQRAAARKGGRKKTKNTDAEDPADEERAYNRTEKTIEQVAARLRERLSEEPELSPYLGPAPKTRSGRPSLTRLNPLFTFKAVPRRRPDGNGDEADGEGNEAYPEFEVTERKVDASVQDVRILRRRTKPLVRAGTAFASDERPRAVTQPIGNLQLALRPSSDLPKDAPYRWDHDEKGEPVLRVNVKHRLHRAAAEHVGSDAHRIYLATIAALALAEKRWSVVDRQGISDYVLEIVEDVLTER